MIPVRIQYADIPPSRRIIAVSDVHAHRDDLDALLRKVDFCADDALVLVGDILERGPRSLDTLRYVMRLCQTRTVYPLIGNVDEWMLNTVLESDAGKLAREAEASVARHGGSFRQDAADAVGMALSPDMDVEAFRVAVREALAEEYAFMEGLPTILATPDFIFTHGGIEPGPLEAMAGRPSRELTKRDAFMDEGTRFDRYVVVGHWPVCLYAKERMQYGPVVSVSQRIIAIDGGCGIKEEGQLNALLLRDGRWAWTSHDTLPRRVARDAQAGGGPAHCITFMNGDVDVLERADGMALVAHRPDGYRMWTPDNRVFIWNGDQRCNDITDARLDVRPGDILTVIDETAHGLYCRLNGVAGWYHGRTAPTPSGIVDPPISCYNSLP